ncbi:Asp23/Gls24 family envelope stress response protein [Candidatus Aerophobetes bacterium]|nr:Asp23/Gls24 family envelope stress response protein [Candidatus Aerophobetes bacterium]
MEKENSYEVEKKVTINLIKKIVREVDGVHSIKSGFLGKTIRIKQDFEGMDISLGLVLKRGTFIPEVAQEVQKKLKQEMEKTLGTSVRKIDIKIKGIKFSP